MKRYGTFQIEVLDVDISRNALRVYLWMSANIDKECICYAKLETIAKALDIRIDNLKYRYINELKANKLIQDGIHSNTQVGYYLLNLSNSFTQTEYKSTQVEYNLTQSEYPDSLSNHSQLDRGSSYINSNINNKPIIVSKSVSAAGSTSSNLTSIEQTHARIKEAHSEPANYAAKVNIPSKEEKELPEAARPVKWERRELSPGVFELIPKKGVKIKEMSSYDECKI